MISLSAVEQAIIKTNQLEGEVIAQNISDPQKGESIVLLHQEGLDSKLLKKAMLDGGCNPLMIPKHYIEVEQMPKLGSGKTDFVQAKAIAMQRG